MAKTQPAPMVVQLTDEQWKDLRGEFADLRKQASAAITRLEARSLALAAGGDVLVSRDEAGAILRVSAKTVDEERRLKKLPAAPHWKGRFSLLTLLRVYSLEAPANDP